MKVKIGHAHLKVRDLDRAAAFYSRFLGLGVRERLGDRFVFMTGGEPHHELALMNVGSGASGPPAAGTGLFHVAFEAPDRRALAACFKELQEGGIPVVAVDHRISLALYFSDPDGNGLEVYCDTRREPGGAALWEGRDRPLAAAQLLAALEGRGGAKR